MLRVRTLGGLSVDGVAESGSRTPLQRRPLALLAVLAASRTGVSRDKLVAYFWPESDEERARNVLRQLVHTVRRDVGIPDLIVGSTELRLNPSLSTSDVAEFDAACDAGELDRAVAVYDGPFLSGFYLTNAPAFEAWKEGERARLAQRFARAVEQLASHATALGDHTRALESWRRLAAVEPLNSRVAIALMRALAAAGDVGGALAHARVHEAMMREELEATPGAEFEAAVAGIRGVLSSVRVIPLSANPEALSSDSTDDQDPLHSRAPEASRLSEFAVADTTPYTTPQVRKQRFTSRRLGVAAAASVLLLVAAIMRSASEGDETAAAGRSPGVQSHRLAVLDFGTRGASQALPAVAGTIADMIRHELSGVNAFDVVPNHLVNPSRAPKVDFDRLAASLRIGSVVDGNLAHDGDTLRLTVRLTDASSGSQLMSALIERASSDVFGAQQEVALAAAAAIRRRIGKNTRVQALANEVRDPKVRELLLRADQARDDARTMADYPHPADVKTAREALARADALYEAAGKLEPGRERTQIERGWSFYELARLQNGVEQQRTLERARLFSDAVLRRDSSNVDALELRSILRWSAITAFSADAPSPLQADSLRDIERDLRLTLARDSTRARSWESLSYLLWLDGRFAEADLTAKRAMREDAYLRAGRDVFLQLFYSALMLADNAGAREWCRRGRQAHASDWRFVECDLTLMRHDHSATPNPRRAWLLVHRLDLMDPPPTARASGHPYQPIYRRMVAAAISARAGQETLARAELARARAATAHDSALRLDLAPDEAYIRLLLGERTQAIALVRAFISARPVMRALLARDPLLGVLITDVQRPNP